MWLARPPPRLSQYVSYVYHVFFQSKIMVLKYKFDRPYQADSAAQSHTSYSKGLNWHGNFSPM